MNIRRLLPLLAALFTGLGVTTQAHAIWTFGGVDGGNANTNYTANNSSSAGSNANLEISGVYAANGGSYTNSSSYTINGFQSGANFSTSTLKYYAGGGLGMSSDGTSVPNHGMDNGPSTDSGGAVTGLGNTESVLLKFASSVVLNSIGLGYKNGDADISLFRWVGAAAPASLAGTGASLSSMTSAGWELVGNYGDLAVDTSNPYNLVNAGNKGSSWWLVSAYNTDYGSTNSGGGSLGQGNDYFKVFAAAGTDCVGTNVNCGNVNRTPEPSSLALVGLAALGAVRVRRRFAKAA